jgi:signal transduction histidine kinase
MRKKEKGQNEQLEVMQMVGASIAHEVKTPIATMSMCANALSEVLKNTLVTQSKNKQTHNFTLDNNEYELLLNVTDSMQRLSKKGVTTADNILISLRTSVVANDKKLYSLKECVQEALEEYAAHHEAVKNIQVSIPKTLIIYCSLYYFKHLLFNLLKNAYKYNGQDVKIKIWAKGRKLYFKDFGNGIDENDLPHIFKRFYTKSETGTGIGLPFCRMVMEDLGGTIECNSKLGQFTEFTLTFPLV